MVSLCISSIFASRAAPQTVAPWHKGRLACAACGFARADALIRLRDLDLDVLHNVPYRPHKRLSSSRRCRHRYALMAKILDACSPSSDKSKAKIGTQKLLGIGHPEITPAPFRYSCRRVPRPDAIL